MSINLHHECQEYHELDGSEVIYDVLKNQPPANWFFQIKQDGIWCSLVISNGEIRYYSKTGQLKHIANYNPELFPLGHSVLIGEFMFGSQRSTDPTVAGKFFCFDCVIADGQTISSGSYSARYRLAQSIIDRIADPRFEIVRCYSMEKYAEILTLLQDKVEGFIFRSWKQPYSDKLYKFKFEVEDDFIVTGMVEGLGKHAGRMGALMLSQHDPDTGKLVYVQNVGGGFNDVERHAWWQRKDSTYGTIVLVRGKGRFSDGALRHPTFLAIRTDKDPSKCIIKRTSR